MIIEPLCVLARQWDGGGMHIVLPRFLLYRCISKEWRRALDYRWVDLMLDIGCAYGVGQSKEHWGRVDGRYMGNSKPVTTQFSTDAFGEESVYKDVPAFLNVVIPFTVSVLLKVRADAESAAAARLGCVGLVETCPIRHCVTSMPVRTRRPRRKCLPSTRYRRDIPSSHCSL